MIKLDEQTERLLLGYLEGDLDEAERWRAEAELTRRPELAKWVRAMMDDRAALRGVADQDVPEAVRETVDALREREALLGDAPAAPGLGGDLGGDLRVAGRIRPASAPPLRAGDRALRVRRWTIRLAAAAAVLLCAAVMVQSIVGTNLLRSALPGGGGGGGAGREDLAMRTSDTGAAARLAERETDSLRRREAEESSATERAEAAPPIEDTAPASPSLPDPSVGLIAGGSLGDVDALAKRPGSGTAGVDALLAASPTSTPVEDELASEASVLAEASSSLDVMPAGRLNTATMPDRLAARGLVLDKGLSTRAAAEPIDREGTAVGGVVWESVDGRIEPSALSGELVQPAGAETALRVEVDTPDPDGAYNDLQRWALSNAVVFQSPDPAVAGLFDGRDGDAIGSRSSADAAASDRRGVRSRAGVESSEVQVVQLAVPADRVDALLVHLNAEGRQPVRLLSDSSEAVAQRGMTIDRHPQVQWVPAEPAAGESTAGADATGDESLDDPSTAYRDDPATSTIAGVDLAAMLRAQAPTVATRSLSEWLPEPPVTVELRLRQQPETAVRPATEAMPTSPTFIEDAKRR